MQENNHKLNNLLNRINLRNIKNLFSSYFKCFLLSCEKPLKQGFLFFSNESSIGVALYITCCGLAAGAIEHFFKSKSYNLFNEWIFALTPISPRYNVTSIVYVLLVLFAFLGVAIIWILQSTSYSYLKINNSYIKRILIYVLSCVNMIGFLIFNQFPIYLFVASQFLLIAFYIQNGYRFPIFQIPFPSMCVVILLLSLGIFFKSWYPTIIPNDYNEIQDTVVNQTPDGGLVATPRVQFIKCFDLRMTELRQIRNFEKSVFASHTENNSDCQKFVISDFFKINNSLVNTSIWQDQTGRLLYHHSYYFIPAIHFLKYGIFEPIPYLYGVLNTLLHAGLMKLSSESLTGYFMTFPIAHALGILMIVGAVFFITRSFNATISSLSIALYFLFRINFETLFLAPGLSPSRFIGVLSQILSIAFLFRSKNTILSVFLCSCASIFSVFWNTEYALFGLVGQSLAFTSPYIFPTSRFRIIGLFIVYSTVIASIVSINFLSRGYDKVIYAGLFEIGVPESLKTFEAAQFIAACILSIVILLFFMRNFSKVEMNMRISILVVLMLLFVKFLFYPMRVHLFFALSLVAALSVIYYPWILNKNVSKLSESLFTLFVASSALVMALQYMSNANNFRQNYTDIYLSKSWTNLGEELKFVTPQDPILERVNTIKSVMEENDTFLILSPFDHLLGFYLNPRGYCGHFELITNLIDKHSVNSAIDCALSRNNILIIYDDALKSDCPERLSPELAKYGSLPSCQTKRNIESTELLIFESLKAKLKLIKKEGSLEIYRVLNSSPSRQVLTPE